MSGEESSAFSEEIRYLAHEEARPGQLEMIHDCLKALQQGGHHLAAAPTGIGKTAAALAAAIDAARTANGPRTIFFLTSRQSQHKIVVDTVRRINARRPPQEKVRLVDMVGQSNMCVQPFAKESPPLFSLLCSQARSQRTCKPYLTQAPGLRQRILSDPLHVDELVQMAQTHSEHGVPTLTCPWKAAREAVSSADVFVGDYNHLFVDAVRDASLNAMELDLSDIIVIVDEAHNLPDRIRMGMERRFTPTVVRNATIDLEEYTETIAKAATSLGSDGLLLQASLTSWALSVMKVCRGRISDLFRDLLSEPAEFEERRVDVERLRNIFLASCDEVEGKVGQQQLQQEQVGLIEAPGQGLDRLKILRDVLLDVEIKVDADDENPNIDIDAHRIGHLLEDMLRFGETTALVYVHDAKGKEGRIISHLLDPGLVSGPVFKKCAGSILMSGTLYPPKMYADLLGIGHSKTTSRQYDSPFANQRRPIVVAKDVTTRYQDRSYENTQRIRAHLQSLCDGSPGHVAVFTPSYSMLNDYIGEGQFHGVVVRMEDRTWSKQDVDQLLDVLEDAKQVGRRILLAGVFGGRLSEGIDYHNGLLDAVACIGIPNPPPSIHQKALRTYIEERFGRANAWRYASTQPAINAILQAMGRPIRSIADRALILLLDKRNTDRTYIECYPKDIRMNTSTEPET
ncbi:MAG: ATP-dependent DNA helicase, partial [Candidatus Thermoplasmatota archaeon]|nr:ATP-dependent DNA helicase [Candidatus Thermoplasmatota archaeon]